MNAPSIGSLLRKITRLLQDIKDLKKVLKRRSESGTEARSFFRTAEKARAGK